METTIMENQMETTRALGGVLTVWVLKGLHGCHWDYRGTLTMY